MRTRRLESAACFAPPAGSTWCGPRQRPERGDPRMAHVCSFRVGENKNPGSSVHGVVVLSLSLPHSVLAVASAARLKWRGGRSRWTM